MESVYLLKKFNFYKSTGWIALIFTVWLYYIFFYSQFLPLENGMMGEDYGQFLPLLLEGYFWFLNNGLSVAWGSPILCAGLPRFANLESSFYTVPQILTIFFGPISSIKGTIIIFSAIGFISTYSLFRHVYKLNFKPSLLGAILILFNLFFAHCLIYGHLTYHTFMLVPTMSVFLLKPEMNKTQWTLSSVMSAIVMSYILFAGAIDMVPNYAAVVILFFLFYFWQNPKLVVAKYFLYKSMLSLALAFCLSAAKIVAALEYARYFPRDHLPIPGIDSFWLIIYTFLKSVFFRFRLEEVQHHFHYLNTTLDEIAKFYSFFPNAQEEFDFGIGFFPLILFFLFGWQFIVRKGFKTFSKFMFLQKRHLLILPILFLLILPILLNYYSPQWNGFLKTIPFIKNSSFLFRWGILYMYLFVFLSTLAFEKLELNSKYKSMLLFLSIVSTTGYWLSIDRAYYKRQTYNPSSIIESYNLVSQKKERIPPIVFVAIDQNQSDRDKWNSDFGTNFNQKHLDKNMWQHFPRDFEWYTSRNNLFTAGGSQILCHETMFGYDLEKFPIGNLKIGPVFKANGDYFNFKRPECYLFPEENDCQPGDHFKLHQRAQLASLVTYHPYGFKMSTYQQIANGVSIVTLAAFFLFMAFLIAKGLFAILTGKSESTPH